MTIFINPGSGPVAAATAANADACMRQFVADLRDMGVTVVEMRQPGLDDGGRFGYALHSQSRPNGQAIEVEMPGLSVDKVRYTGDDGQNIWDFPRLYVDGDSWIWCYALDIVKDTIRGGSDD
ncbi:hypothetical protein NLX86_19095 [Streptomyces sp. A3M-1-3]|uniref:hypothetical protein n=1 Tax=Streptomyces sp. A3M-1-3 TaxID=2962044 RepID=UPI0020B660B6|nr:hypothetical protein [Streptomyces sp. A3M-1-3]MCP3820126.1 hypothetical protein [Streptomyces sp. A3M-1-3]